MSLHVGIVGLPNVGKSTLFKALTNNPVDINNYPFCTIEPNVGVVEVPDERLTKLAEMSKSQKVVPAVVEFVDIAGLVKGASTGEGLGNKFLSNIREVDAIVQVVRVFENGNITHVHDSVSPLRDIEIIETELVLADLETVSKTAERLARDAKGNNKDAIAQMEFVESLQKELEEGVLARNAKTVSLIGDGVAQDDPRRLVLRDMQLLTMKPILYVFNVSDLAETLPDELESRPHVKLDIKIEEELMEMSAEDAAELGMESHLHDLIVRSYDLLGLETYFTTGETETRAWTIKKGSTAPEAGAAIHTDFQEKFIRADLVSTDDLLSCGSRSAARDAGKLKTVGKDHVVLDGDVIEFKV